MNELDDVELNKTGFSFRDLLQQDRWNTFDPTFTGITSVGAFTALGRLRIVGRECQFQAQFSAATSIATVAGTSYMTLPIPAQGVAGIATMMNATSNVAVGVCVIDVANSRCYLPTQTTSGNTFKVAGRYEI